MAEVGEWHNLWNVRPATNHVDPVVEFDVSFPIANSIYIGDVHRLSIGIIDMPSFQRSPVSDPDVGH